MAKYGHWTYQGKLDVKAFGFLYEITNIQSGRKYLGCKQFTFKRGKKRIESDWKIYTGSSKLLNGDIATMGKGNFNYNILRTYPDRPSLRYAEAKAIIIQDAINRPDYYNQLLRIRILKRKSK